MLRQMKEMIQNAQNNDYDSFVKALISLEYNIDDEKKLDELYTSFMHHDGINLLNDVFDEWIDEGIK